MLINGFPYIMPTNQSDEKIAGHKEFTDKIKFLNGLQLVSPNGQIFNIQVDDTGSLKTNNIDNEVQNG